MDDIIFRRGQFYLGPENLLKYANWKSYLINSNTYLMAHPSLDVFQVQNGIISATLIGFVIDPDFPEYRNEEVITSFLNKFSFARKSFPYTYKLGGRYILIISDAEEILVFSDAAGNRQMFYTDTNHINQLWCASEIGILQEICKLKPDSEALSFMNTPEFKNNDEYWWPSDTTMFREVRRLPPNHYLCLNDGKCIRYWPDQPLKPKKSKQAAMSVARTMKSLVKGASNRGDLALSITAGIDSRLVLASCKDIANDISFVTVKKKEMQNDHADLFIPKKILSDLRLPHIVLYLDKSIRKSFRENYFNSILNAHAKRMAQAQAIFDYNHANKIAMYGNVAEIARLKYEKHIKIGEKITPATLSSCAQMGNHPFVIAAFEKWLDQLTKSHNYEINALFHWEQRDGSWLASGAQSEYSLVWKDMFTPYNCRALLIDMLSVDRRLRRAPDLMFFKDVIQILWPTLLKYPINPHVKASQRNRLKRFVRRKVLRLVAK